MGDEGERGRFNPVTTWASCAPFFDVAMVFILNLPSLTAIGFLLFFESVFVQEKGRRRRRKKKEPLFTFSGRGGWRGCGGAVVASKEGEEERTGRRGREEERRRCGRDQQPHRAGAHTLDSQPTYSVLLLPALDTN